MLGCAQASAKSNVRSDIKHARLSIGWSHLNLQKPAASAKMAALTLRGGTTSAIAPVTDIMLFELLLCSFIDLKQFTVDLILSKCSPSSQPLPFIRSHFVNSTQ